MCENGATLKIDSCTCGCADGYGGDNCGGEYTAYHSYNYIHASGHSTNAEDLDAILCDQLPTLTLH